MKYQKMSYVVLENNIKIREKKQVKNEWKDGKEDEFKKKM